MNKHTLTFESRGEVEPRFRENRHTLVARLNRTLDELNHLAGGGGVHPGMWAFDKHAATREVLITSVADDAYSLALALAAAINTQFPHAGKADAQ